MKELSVLENVYSSFQRFSSLASMCQHGYYQVLFGRLRGHLRIESSSVTEHVSLTFLD